jgi:hypothetical protein
MNIAGFIFVFVAHFISGSGILRLFKINLPVIANICISIIAGVVVMSFAPCLLQLAGVPINQLSVITAIVILTLFTGFPLLKNIRQFRFHKFLWPEIYEWPFIVIFAILLFISAWRCFYYPPTPYDMISGPELLAEYAVREHTMLSSVFNIDLHMTNNYFKSPFITGLQIIYKLLVCPFGQMWLSLLYISFIIWLYTIAREKLHPVLAGLLMLFFITVPDLYAYSFLMLYDFSNMILFFCGFYFITKYLESKGLNNFIFSSFLFGLATFIRNETLVLVCMVLPLMTIYLYRQKINSARMIRLLLLFIGIPAAFYFICLDIFVKNFIPVHFNLGSQINSNLSDFSPFFERLRDINSELIFSKFGMGSYGYFIYFFCGLFLLDLVWKRRFDKETIISLYGILVVYFGLPFLGYILPLVDLMNTTKRGLFKLLPLMFLYICNSGALIQLSAIIKKWEVKAGN